MTEEIFVECLIRGVVCFTDCVSGVLSCIVAVKSLGEVIGNNARDSFSDEVVSCGIGVLLNA